MSRCWDVANFCPLVVFVGGVRIAGVRIAGVRLVEFGSKRVGILKVLYQSTLRVEMFR